MPVRLSKHLRLSKHQGLGNDFLVYELTGSAANFDWPAVAKDVCDRRFGVGADGLLLLNRLGGGNLVMTLFNADGSRAEISGNGIRCLVQAAYMADNHDGPVTYVVNTDAGERVVDVVEGSRSSNTIQASVSMGEVAPLQEPSGWHLLECNPDRPVLHLSLGNPHSVVSVEDVTAVDLQTLGQRVPHVNLEIVEAGPEINGITMRVHERGSGITLACGSGACASAFAAVAWGFVPASSEEVLVHMDGGDARVRVNRDTSHATLIGPSVFVADVEFHL